MSENEKDVKEQFIFDNFDSKVKEMGRMVV